MITTPEDDLALAATGGAGTEEVPAGTLIGEYKVEHKLGQGGMGTVYAANHPVIGKRVAIKVLSHFFSRDAGLVKRFIGEARAVNKIGHPNIIDVFSFGQLPDGRHYFVMELLEGETMTAWLDRGRPPPAEARRLLLQICEALEAAHREGIVHRDLKPDNIWIARPKHGEPFVKVLDFGIAKLIASNEASGGTQTGAVMGTPLFMSPEQCMGRGVDHHTDIYAMGAILFNIYCGRLPFSGASSAEIIAAQLYQPPPKPSTFASMAPALEALILECLEKNPAKRPATAADLGLRLKEASLVAGLATEVHAPLHPTEVALADTHKGYQPSEPDKNKGRARSRSIALACALVVANLRRGAVSAKQAHSVSSGEAMAPPAPAPAVQPTPAAAEATPAAPPAPAPEPPPIAGTVPHKRGRPVAGKLDTSTAPLPSPVPLDKGHKPSRAAREGLIQENPF